MTADFDFLMVVKPKRHSVIAKLAFQAGLSFAQIARQAGISASNLTLLARGRSVSRRFALAIASVLTRAKPELREAVDLWLIALGYAPERLRIASPKLQRAILRALYNRPEEDQPA